MADRNVLRVRDRVLDLTQPVIMGVVNASPESFSDGRRVGGLADQVEKALALIRVGATIIDVGGESGVTNRPPISADEESARVVPLVEQLVGAGIIVSVDTWKAPVAQAVIEAGAHIINDVSGLRDTELAAACGRSGAALVIMHTRAAPKRKEFPSYVDVTSDVVSFLEQRIETALGLGVGDDSIVLDPGPDFAKTPAQTIEVLRRLPSVAALGRPILLAVSRKDFVGALTHRRPSERLAGTLAAVGEGLDAGASILRVHDVAAVDDFLKVRAALRGDTPVSPDLHLPESHRREDTG